MRKYYFTIQLYLDNEETQPKALNAILIVFVVVFCLLFAIRCHSLNEFFAAAEVYKSPRKHVFEICFQDTNPENI